MVGIKFVFCTAGLWDTQQEAIIYEGDAPQSTWTDNVMCSTDKYIVTAMLKVDTYLDADVGSVAGMKIKCANRFFAEEEEILVHEGLFG